MALTQRLEIRQSQALVMTPQLMQAIKLLQLSSLDLAAYVDAELERNPLLEQSSAGEGDGGDGAPSPLERPFRGVHVSPRDALRDHESGRRAGHRRSSTDVPRFDAKTTRGLIVAGMICVRIGLTWYQWYHRGTSRPNVHA